MREFNVTGICVPGKHYMADTSEKLSKIFVLIEKGKYFSINCARQYGKTTTIFLLEQKLPEKGYTPIWISFEGVNENMFDNETLFCSEFLRLCTRELEWRKEQCANDWKDNGIISFSLLSDFINNVCQTKKYVLMIDEVDKSSNNLLFLRFLGMLRDKYLARDSRRGYTFQSVILVGVYNIKNLKIKMVQAGTHQLQDGESRINSPWNIAVDHKIDMSLNIKEISSMLADYENDHKTGMDIEAVATEIRIYTNGYPYLVSRICQIIEEDLDKNWTTSGVDKAIKIMLLERTVLVDDISKNLANHKELNDIMFNIIALGKKYEYNASNLIIDLALTFGFLIKQNGSVVIGNKFFEMLLYRHYTLEITMNRDIRERTLPSEVIFDGKLDMQLAIEKFAQHYYEIYKRSLKKFIEGECRLLFLTYLQPLINGGGFYHVESETRDAKRMDVVVDYGIDQFIVELKLWYGEAAHEKAFDQLVGYLDRKNKDVGYLITFDFRKVNNAGAPKTEWIEHKGKKIFDVMVGI